MRNSSSKLIGLEWQGLAQPTIDLASVLMVLWTNSLALPSKLLFLIERTRCGCERWMPRMESRRGVCVDMDASQGKGRHKRYWIVRRNHTPTLVPTLIVSGRSCSNDYSYNTDTDTQIWCGWANWSLALSHKTHTHGHAIASPGLAEAWQRTYVQASIATMGIH